MQYDTRNSSVWARSLILTISNLFLEYVSIFSGNKFNESVRRCSLAILPLPFS